MDMACHILFFRRAREGVNHEEEKIMKNATRKITYAAMIAALYAALTLILQPLSRAFDRMSACQLDSRRAVV